MLADIEQDERARVRNMEKTESEENKLKEKADLIKSKKSEVINHLQELYAKGLISEKRYDKLLKRGDDINLDLIVFCKKAGIALAKRYIGGEINKKEYEKIFRKIMPKDVFDERQEILRMHSELFSNIKKFTKNRKKRACQKCSKEKRWYSNIYRFENISLCKRCKNELEKLLKFKGYEGKYLYCKSRKFRLDEIKEKKVEAIIRNQYL